MINIDSYLASTYIKDKSKVKSHKEVSLPILTPPSNVIQLHKWKKKDLHIQQQHVYV